MTPEPNSPHLPGEPAEFAAVSAPTEPTASVSESLPAEPPPPPPARGRGHRTDLVSLLFGLLFLAVAGGWAGSTYLHWRVDLNLPNLGWFVAGGLIMVGLLGLIASLRRDSDARRGVGGSGPH